jgi:hypothetical protein
MREVLLVGYTLFLGLVIGFVLAVKCFKPRCEECKAWRAAINAHKKAFKELRRNSYGDRDR